MSPLPIKTLWYVLFGYLIVFYSLDLRIKIDDALQKASQASIVKMIGELRTIYDRQETILATLVNQRGTQELLQQSFQAQLRRVTLDIDDTTKNITLLREAQRKMRLALQRLGSPVPLPAGVEVNEVIDSD